MVPQRRHLSTTIYLLLGCSAVLCVDPEFAEPITNVTAAVGREAVLQCTVDSLGTYKVAWIKMDTQTLLTIHNRVITRDTRIRVTNSNHRQWYLHIRDLQVSDQGFYMCQINTEPMVSQHGYLDVTVPPSILEEKTSSDTMIDERSKVSLRCTASGYPTPTITWRREDGKDINLSPYGGKKHAAKVEGEYLNITQVTRDDMGAYLCIASNGIPPSVSKRIMLQVNFRPKIRVPNQLVGAAAGTDVLLECKLEASPRPLTSWIRNDGMIVLNNKKYQLTEEDDSYRILMKLRINNLHERDFGSYKCVAKNTLGEKEGFIRLYEIPPPTSLPQPTAALEVYMPRMRELQNNRNESYSPRKSYGQPASNSLMDESHNLSTDKNTKAKGEDRSNNRQQHSYINPTPKAESALSGCLSSKVNLFSSLSLVTLSVLWKNLQ
ncbi:lachesin-like [Centruroides sculpturatus]|uniref:lachesin-like n=1 Tax=Centruroides sculpturatus TaxID=218467 RepID=UPI000C6D2ED2|nr:lachesin-like [Centruroides sculpturatus]